METEVSSLESNKVTNLKDSKYSRVNPEVNSNSDSDDKVITDSESRSSNSKSTPNGYSTPKRVTLYGDKVRLSYIDSI